MIMTMSMYMCMTMRMIMSTIMTMSMYMIMTMRMIMSMTVAEYENDKLNEYEYYCEYVIDYEYT